MLIEGPIMAAKDVAAECVDVPPLIGPNAVLQSVAAMRHHLGEATTQAILDDAQIDALPSGDQMIPEIEAIRLHRWLALREPAASFAIAADAGARTADYIITHRIPKAAMWLLRSLPASLAAPLLMQAIRRHEWTFIGAGRFEPQGSWAFSIDRNRADDAVIPPDSLFHWYAAVFTRLYCRLVNARCVCRDRGPGDGPSQRHCYIIERGS